MTPRIRRMPLRRALRGLSLAGLVVLVAAATTLGLINRTSDPPTSVVVPAPVGQSTAPGTSVGPVQPEVRARVTRTAGTLSHSGSARLATQAGTLVKDFLTDAYLTAPGSASYAVLTPGARREARADQMLLTDRGFPEGWLVSRVQAHAYVAAVVPRKRAVGASIRLVVRFGLDPAPGATTSKAGLMLLTGRLSVTPTTAGWRIFGYDLALGPDRPIAGATPRKGNHR